MLGFRHKCTRVKTNVENLMSKKVWLLVLSVICVQKAFKRTDLFLIGRRQNASLRRQWRSLRQKELPGSKVSSISTRMFEIELSLMKKKVSILSISEAQKHNLCSLIKMWEEARGSIRVLLFSTFSLVFRKKRKKLCLFIFCRNWILQQRVLVNKREAEEHNFLRERSKVDEHRWSWKNNWGTQLFKNSHYWDHIKHHQLEP